MARQAEEAGRGLGRDAPESPPLHPSQRELISDYFDEAVRLYRVHLARSPWLAEELMDVATQGLIEAARSYLPGARSFRAWLAVKIAWGVKAEMRRLARRRARLRRIGPLVAYCAATLANHHLPCEDREEVAHLLEGLPSKTGSVLHAVFLEGITQCEAARRLGCSQAEIQRQIRLARTLAPKG